LGILPIKTTTKKKTKTLSKMKQKLEETEILFCHCHSSEYQILVHHSKDDRFAVNSNPLIHKSDQKESNG
jgi:Rieske Fe-S protein